MEQTPKYKLGQKVWFVAENENVCYGIINTITPVNYTFNYNIKMNLHSIGEVVKNTVWEEDILGDYNDDIVDIINYAANHGVEKELDQLILKRLFSLGVLNRKENNKQFESIFKNELVGGAERVILSPGKMEEIEDAMYDENGWKNIGNGLKMDRHGNIAGGLKPSNNN